MSLITKEHAYSIAKKLRAQVVTGRKAHDRAFVYHGDVVIAQFGIRRGSKKNAGHGHIPADLGIGPHDTLRLANCPMSREEYIRRIVGPEEEEEGEVGQ